MEDNQRDLMIKKEFNKYRRIYKNLEKDKKIFAEKLCSQLAFMSITLNDLQDEIKKDGPVKEVTNGNGFKVINEHPAQKSYNAMIKNYNATIKALIDLLPAGTEEDELIEFISEK